MSLPLVELSDGWAVAVDGAVWAVGGTVTGYVTHRLRGEAFSNDTWLTRPRAGERPERYERWLRIKAWKSRLPEAGALFANGFDKRRLRSRGVEHYEQFVVETRRAEVTHWVVLSFAPWFFLWNPPWLALVMVAYAAVANLPCIAIQRYNRLRLQRVLARSRAKRSR